MTNLEAVNSEILYPIANENTIIKALFDNGLKHYDEYKGPSKEFDLSIVKIYKMILGAPNLVEGGFQVNQTNKSIVVDLINDYLRKYDLPLYVDIPQPKIVVYD